MDEVSNGLFNLYEVGAIEDKGTIIDAGWRMETRAKRVGRPQSAVNKKTENLDKRLHNMDNASFDTSSHHTIDYLLNEGPAKSWTFGHGRRFMHIRKPRPVKRTLSANSFNWNLLVDRVDERMD